jgi:hypothetical protein
MATDEDWGSYLAAVVDMAPPGRDPFRIEPDTPGHTGPWPDGVPTPVVVVTAWNPDSVVLDPEVNRARHARLVAELDRSGLAHWPATGRDPESAHHEIGLAVPGLTVEQGAALGRRHGQAAVYRWTPDAWTVISCTDDRRRTTGWRLTRYGPGAT